jgi:type II secretory pathway pseudopilin PulG
MIELVVAIGILAFVLSALAQGLAGSLRGVGLSKQRQTATGMANELMERARGLDFADLTTGDLLGLLPDEPATQVVDATTYTRTGTVADYTASSADARLVTVTVTWSPSLVAGADARIQLQSVFTQSTCEASLDNGRPCESYWYAAGAQEAPTFKVSGTVDGVAVDATLDLGGADVQTTTEQYSLATADATLASLLQASGTEGGLKASAAANDTSDGPSSDAPVDVTQAELDETVGPLTVVRGAALAHVAASAEVDPGDGLGSATATITPTSASKLSVTLPDGSVADLVRVGSSGTPTSTVTASRTAERVATTVARSSPTVVLMDLPAAYKPASGWSSGFLSLSSWASTVTRSTKASELAASQSGTVACYQGCTYDPAAGALWSAEKALTIAPATFTSGSCTIQLSAETGRVGAYAVSSTSKAFDAPLEARIRLVQTCGGVERANLVLDATLGQTVAEVRNVSVPGDDGA